MQMQSSCSNFTFTDGAHAQLSLVTVGLLAACRKLWLSSSGGSVTEPEARQRTFRGLDPVFPARHSKRSANRRRPCLEKAAKNSDPEVRRRVEELVLALDTALYRELHSFRGHDASVYDVTFSPDGKQGLSGSQDKTLRLWHVETGKELRCFQGHTGAVGNPRPKRNHLRSKSSSKTDPPQPASCKLVHLLQDQFPGGEGWCQWTSISLFAMPMRWNGH